MQIILRCTLLLAFLVLCTQGVLAQTGIRDTKHNLSLTEYSPTESGTATGICSFCHTPHGTTGDANTPLWNRELTQVSYQVYTSPTLDATAVGGPSGTSLACLSCHDGTMAFDTLRTLTVSNGSTANGGTSGSTDVTFHSTVSGSLGSASNLGTDLRNDHPVSMRYVDARSPSSTNPLGTAGFRPVIVDGAKKCVARSGITSCSDPEALPLSSTTTGGPADYVQCTSCHDPHQKPEVPTFLRKPNGGSALCLTCHVKDS